MGPAGVTKAGRIGHSHRGDSGGRESQKKFTCMCDVTEAIFQRFHLIFNVSALFFTAFYVTFDLSFMPFAADFVLAAHPSSSQDVGTHSIGAAQTEAQRASKAVSASRLQLPEGGTHGGVHPILDAELRSFTNGRTHLFLAESRELLGI